MLLSCHARACIIIAIDEYSDWYVNVIPGSRMAMNVLRNLAVALLFIVFSWGAVSGSGFDGGLSGLLLACGDYQTTYELH